MFMSVRRAGQFQNEPCASTGRNISKGYDIIKTLIYKLIINSLTGVADI
jgi:hypothetical protein